MSLTEVRIGGGGVDDIDDSGTVKRYNANGLLDGGDDDLPAIEWTDGSKEWYRCGRLHRDSEFDLPAVEFVDGTREWCVRERGGARPRPD